jgi:hypothetical protein
MQRLWREEGLGVTPQVQRMLDPSLNLGRRRYGTSHGVGLVHRLARLEGTCAVAFTATALLQLFRDATTNDRAAHHACTGHAGATAASVRDEQRTAVCRGAPRALAAAGVSASTERLAERDPCANVDAAAVAGMPEIGEFAANSDHVGRDLLRRRGGTSPRLGAPSCASSQGLDLPRGHTPKRRGWRYAPFAG